uniref:Core shell protein Gag P30 domain-containing protein n=1 Tax=Cyanistes caeruleus TaxID=156563 RepID=A0A8C0UTB4_CYACU
MGAVCSKTRVGNDIPNSPLTCILNHWEKIGGDSLLKSRLIQYCNHLWPLYKLDNQAKWPENGTLDYHTLLELRLFCRREGKWSEMPYVDLFFTLRDHLELQRGCLPSLSNPLMLAFGKEREKDRRPKRSCSSCSIGHHCLKCHSRWEEDDVEMLEAPGAGDRGIENWGEPDKEEAQGGAEQSGGRQELISSPVVGRTQGEQEVRKQEVGKQEMREQEVGKQEVTEQDIGEQEMTEQDIGEQEVREQEVGEQEVGEQEVKKQEVGEQEERKLEGDKQEARAQLWAGVGSHSLIVVKVPFSPVDLEAWMRLAGPYREDPERVSRVFETILKTQNPDWGVIQVLLYTLLDSTERKMVLRTARKEVDRIGTAGELPGTLEEHFPSQDPCWDPNTKEGRLFLEQYQQWILFGFRHAMPKAINWSKLYEVKQEPHETPTAFVERLRATARRYTNIDPEKPEEAVQLASIFIGNSAPDIRKKLQKLEGAESRDLGELLQVAWIAFNNRGEEEENKIREREKEKEQKEKRREIEWEERKKKWEMEREEREKKREVERNRRERCRDAMLSAALQRALFNRRSERGSARGGLQPNQCAYCRGLGHWKRECPKNRKGPKVTELTLHQE